MVILGLILDLGVLVSRRAALQSSADAAARAAYAACRGAPDAGCATEIAGQYLTANLAGAVLEQAGLTASGQVTVSASLTLDRPFAALFHAGPVRLEVRSGFGTP